MTIKKFGIAAAVGFAVAIVAGVALTILGLTVPAALGIIVGCVSYLTGFYVTINVMTAFEDRKTSREFTAITSVLGKNY